MDDMEGLSRAQLHKMIADLKQALIDAKVSHLINDDDCYYSCPMAKDEDGDSACCDSDKKHECDCGAEQHNRKIDEAIARIFKRD